MKEDKEAGASLVQFLIGERSGMGIFSETMYKWAIGHLAFVQTNMLSTRIWVSLHHISEYLTPD